MRNLPLVSPLDRILFLKAQSYLDSQPPEVLTALASYTEEQNYRAGSVIRAAGESVDRIIFLGEGTVALEDDTGSRALRVVRAPGVVGLAHHYSRATSAPRVRALDDTMTLEISVDDFEQILEDHFDLVLQLVRRTGREALNTSRSLGTDRLPEQGFPSREARATPAHLDLVQRLAWARHAPLFVGINLTVLGQLVRFEEPRVFVPGEAIWSKGDRIDGMALLLDGRFRTEGPFGPGRAESGAVVGAWEIAGDGFREEAWVAELPSRALWIPRDLFIDVLEDHFDFAQLYMQRVSEMTIRSWEKHATIAAREISAQSRIGAGK